MEMIGVSASASKAGKTTLISHMLENSRCYNTAVIKTSINNEMDQYKVINDPKIINQEGTDTSRFKKHGANKVILLESPAAEIPSAYQLAENLLSSDTERLFIEGNTIINFLNPNLLFYLNNSEQSEKESAKMVKNRAEIKISTNILLQANHLSDVPFIIQPSALSCYKAHLLAHLFDLKVGQVGKIIKEQDVKVTKCQLGLF